MNKTLKSVIWGLLLILCGVAIAGNALNLWNFTLFFPGWWTLFIIVPCLVSICTEGFKSGTTVFLIIGVILLLACLGIFEWSLIRKLIIPIILVLIGLGILLGSAFHKRKVRIQAENPGYASVGPEQSSVFSTGHYNFNGQPFNGGNYSAVFGGYELDLRNAVIDHDIVIETDCVFGGGDIFLPTNVQVKVGGDHIFGGVSNNFVSNTQPGAPTVFVNADCVFGGLNIR